MAVRAMTTSDVVDYVSDLDPAKGKKFVPVDPEDASKGEVEVETVAENATHFGLKPLDLFLQGWIYDSASELEGTQGSNKVGIKTRINQTNIDAVRFGLAYLKNYTDKAGKPIRFRTEKVLVNDRPYEAVSDEVMNTFGIKLVQELADKIKEISEVTPDEEKNSGSVSLPSG